MKRYKLLRDLPFAKAGTVFWETEFDGWCRKNSEGFPSMSLYVDYVPIIKEFIDNPDWFEIIEETEGRFRPDNGDLLWFINEHGLVGDTTYALQENDSLYYKFGNCFKTEEDALEASKLVEFMLKIFHFWKNGKFDIEEELLDTIRSEYRNLSEVEEIYDSVYSKDK